MFDKLFVLLSTQRSFIKDPGGDQRQDSLRGAEEQLAPFFVLAASQQNPLRPGFSVSIISAAMVNKMVSRVSCSLGMGLPGVFLPQLGSQNLPKGCVVLG